MIGQNSKISNEELKNMHKVTQGETDARMKLNRAWTPVLRVLRARLLNENIDIKPPQPVDYERQLVQMTVFESQRLYLARKMKEAAGEVADVALTDEDVNALIGSPIDHDSLKDIGDDKQTQYPNLGKKAE